QGEHAHEAGSPFGFGYAVKDSYHGNDFSHVADSNGDVIKGEYRTLMPDGRVQIVKYTADWKNGYQAEVIYVGAGAVSGVPVVPIPDRSSAVALQAGQGWSAPGVVRSF
ncbi:unnamed protein product, partial [Allacma fusca]